MQGASKTALGVGILRAMHRLVDREPWVVDDPVSSHLFGSAARALLASDAPRFAGARADALRGHVLVRSAFAEASLRAAVERGVAQCVQLGAGYDTLAYRQPAWLRGVRMYEVDAPETQVDKRERLRAADVAIPPNLTFAAIDFERTSLADGLAAAGFDLRATAFFSWLGVMMYLTRDAVDAVFRFVAARPRGSEIAFTFTVPGRDGDDDSLASRVAALGEPLRTRIAAVELTAMLGELGFRDVTIVSAESARALLGQRSDALTLPDRESMGAAIV
ncbi:MAG TPA: class I SAM-dependent methyltransferase [Candidatus Elarobacter sp.]|nr:class I SAM-dependent methyltransferase [Candidatus Elarobacter sp.]